MVSTWFLITMVCGCCWPVTVFVPVFVAIDVEVCIIFGCCCCDDNVAKLIVPFCILLGYTSLTGSLFFDIAGWTVDDDDNDGGGFVKIWRVELTTSLAVSFVTDDRVNSGNVCIEEYAGFTTTGEFTEF